MASEAWIEDRRETDRQRVSEREGERGEQSKPKGFTKQGDRGLGRFTR